MHSLLSAQLAHTRHDDAVRAAAQRHQPGHDAPANGPRVTIAIRRARSGSRRRIRSALRIAV